MPKVNVVLPDGRVVSVDESVVNAAESDKQGATGSSFHRETPMEGSERITETENAASRHERYGNPLGETMSAVSGALDTLSLGTYGKVMHWAGVGKAYEDEAQENPGARALGEVGSLLVPGLGELGAGAGVTRIAKALGAGTTDMRVIEGAAYGMGGAVASTNASGDPLTVESLVEGAGIGAVLNYGMGALGDRLTSAGKGAADELDTAESANRAQALFEAPHPSYDALREAADSEADNADAVNKGVVQRLDKLDKYADSTEKYANDISDYDNLLKKQLMADINASRKSATVVNSPATGTPPELAALNEKLGVPSEPYQPAAQRLEPGPPPNRWADGVTLKEATDVLDNGIKTVKAASDLRYEGPDGIKKGVEMLRPLREGLAERFHYAVPDLPEPPGMTVADLSALKGLPKDLEGFARMDALKANAFSSQMTPAVETALRGLATELGVTPGATAVDTFVGIQKQLAEHTSALAALEASGGGSSSLLVRMTKWAARKAGYATAGGIVGNIAGAATGIPLAGKVGRMAGGMLGSMAAGDMVSAAAMESRAIIRSKIAKVVAKFGGPSGRAASKLAPVTSYLTTALVSGKKDKSSSDVGQLAKNRLGELAGAATVAPNTVYHALQPIIGVPGDVGLGVHTHINAALQHALASVAKDPGTSPRGTGSDWKPSPMEAIAMAYRLEALQKPLDAMARALSGDVHPDAIDTLHTSWPALSAALANELSGASTDGLSPERLNGYSALMGAPMSGLAVPDSIIALQGMYLPGASQARQPMSQTQQQEQPGQVGRPPKAGQSTIAGSNVGSLISQGQA